MTFMAFTKPFEASQSVKIKIQVNFFSSSRTVVRRVNESENNHITVYSFSLQKANATFI